MLWGSPGHMGRPFWLTALVKVLTSSQTCEWASFKIIWAIESEGPRHHETGTGHLCCSRSKCLTHRVCAHHKWLWAIWPMDDLLHSCSYWKATSGFCVSGMKWETLEKKGNKLAHGFSVENRLQEATTEAVRHREVRAIIRDKVMGRGWYHGISGVGDRRQVLDIF